MKKLLTLFLTLFLSLPAYAQYYPPSGGGGGGSGTVTNTSVVSANGFAGTVVNSTTTPAITLSTTITGLLKGNGIAISAAVSDTDYQAPITLATTGTSGAATLSGNTLTIPQYQGALTLTTTGSSGAATLSGNTLNIPQYSGGGSGLTSVGLQGDGTVIATSVANSPLTANGTLGPLTLANASPMTMLANATGSSAAPAYFYGALGYGAISSTTTLTAASPSFINWTGGTLTMPVSTTCSGKPFFLYNNGTTALQTAIQSTDKFAYNNTITASNSFVSNGTFLILTSDGAGFWHYQSPNIPGFATAGLFANGILYGTNSGYGAFASTNPATNVGGLIQNNGGGTIPSSTLTPGSSTALTSITVTHQIAAGTVPTVVVGAGAGTGGSPGATIAGHDTDFAVTVTTGTVIGTGVIFTVTFGTPYTTTAPYVQVTSGNPAAAALMGGATQWYPTSTTTTMVLNSGTTGLTAAGAVYVFNVHCGQ
jgi:hypothetical protein